MNFKYFDFPIYHDQTTDISQYLSNKNGAFHVFVHSSDWNDANKDLLYKILGAMKQDIAEDVNIYGLKDGENAHLAEHLDFSNNHRFLAFGLNADRLGLQMKTIPYRILQVKQLKVLFSHKLNDLQSNVNYKKQLWGLLQQFNFNV